MEELAVATAVFVFSHFALSAAPVRAPLVAWFGEWPFRIAYSTIALLLLGWMIVAFAAAPRVEVWAPPLAIRFLTVLAMPVAFFLAVAGMTTRNPTAVGQEGAMGAEPAGVLKITRHPAMWGIALWGVLHVLANGNGKGLVLFAAMIVLAVGGMLHIDARKKAAMGPRWDEFAARTSVLPFAALAAGRVRLRFAEIGWGRIAAALAAYAAFLYFHRALFGVAPVPWFSI